MANYCSTEEVLDYLDLLLQVPDYDGGVTTLETIYDAGSASTAVTYTDKTKLIADTYTFSYGASSTATQTNLTETTHYTLNKDIGAFTLNDTGNTLVGSNGVYATYSYTTDFKDSKINDIITRVTQQIDEETEQTWQDSYLEVREEQTGRGTYSRIYRPRKLQPLVVKTQLNGALTSSATSVTLDDTTGLEAGDYLTIEDEVMLIGTVPSTTAITVTRGQFGSTASAHDDDKPLINYAIEISNTPEGFTPTWNVLKYQSGFDVDSDTGAVQLLHINPTNRDDFASDVYPASRTFNRIRLTYKYGNETVPQDIKKLAILMAAKDLFNSQVLNSLSRGKDGFTSEGVNLIQEEIDRLTREHKLLLTDGF